MSISWGVKDRFRFVAAGSLVSWDPPPVTGIYAITANQNPERPKAQTILYLGQAENLSADAPEQIRQVLDAWKNSSQDVRELSVFIHVMPGSNSGELAKVQEQLVSEYRPRCNR